MGNEQVPAWVVELQGSITNQLGELGKKVEKASTDLRTELQTVRTELQTVRDDLAGQIQTHACRCAGSSMHAVAVQALANLQIAHQPATDGVLSD